MKKQQQTIHLIRKAVAENSRIEVVWLYGSRVKGTASKRSDYDLAVAFTHENNALINDDFPCDELAFAWSKNIAVEISVIDINHVPVPLAYSVISDGKIIFCRNDLRLHAEESRIWSMWEAYRYEYARK